MDDFLQGNISAFGPCYFDFGHLIFENTILGSTNPPPRKTVVKYLTFPHCVIPVIDAQRSILVV